MPDNKDTNKRLNQARINIREESYCTNIRILEENLYGLDVPIWTFISRDDVFSESQTEHFIQKLLAPQAEDEYLHAYLYMMIRLMTTEFEYYKIIGKGMVFGPTQATVCWPGSKRKTTMMDLINNIGDLNALAVIGQIYHTLHKNAPADYVRFMGEELEDYYDSQFNEFEKDDDYFNAEWEENPPEKEDVSMNDLTSYEPYEETDEEEEEVLAMRNYLKQQKELPENFPAPHAFINSVETYCRHAMKFGEGYEYVRGDEKAIIYDKAKIYMLQTPYTLFSNRQEIVRTNKMLIRAWTFARHARKG